VEEARYTTKDDSYNVEIHAYSNGVTILSTGTILFTVWSKCLPVNKDEKSGD
jgi:hypothetical protein